MLDKNNIYIIHLTDRYTVGQVRQRVASVLRRRGSQAEVTIPSMRKQSNKSRLQSSAEKSHEKLKHPSVEYKFLSELKKTPYATDVNVSDRKEAFIGKIKVESGEEAHVEGIAGFYPAVDSAHGYGNDKRKPTTWNQILLKDTGDALFVETDTQVTAEIKFASELRYASAFAFGNTRNSPTNQFDPSNSICFQRCIVFVFVFDKLMHNAVNKGIVLQVLLSLKEILAGVTQKIGPLQTTPRLEAMWLPLMLLALMASGSACPDLCQCHPSATDEELPALVRVKCRARAPPLAELPVETRSLAIEGANQYEVIGFFDELEASDSLDDTLQVIQDGSTLNLDLDVANTVSAGAFRTLVGLVRLSLRRNAISSVHEDAFRGLDRLEFLDLSDNRLADLPDSALTPLYSLQKLDLSGNQLQVLGARSLTLNDNDINEIEVGALGQLPALEELDLSDNPVRTLPANTLSGPSNLARLRMSGLTWLERKQEEQGDMAFPVPTPERLVFLDVSRSPVLARQLLADDAALSACKSLIELNLSRTDITALRFDLPYMLPQLRHQQLNKTGQPPAGRCNTPREMSGSPLDELPSPPSPLPTTVIPTTIWAASTLSILSPIERASRFNNNVTASFNVTDVGSLLPDDATVASLGDESANPPSLVNDTNSIVKQSTVDEGIAGSNRVTSLPDNDQTTTTTTTSTFRNFTSPSSRMTEKNERRSTPSERAIGIEEISSEIKNSITDVAGLSPRHGRGNGEKPSIIKMEKERTFDNRIDDKQRQRSRRPSKISKRPASFGQQQQQQQQLGEKKKTEEKTVERVNSSLQRKESSSSVTGNTPDSNTIAEELNGRATDSDARVSEALSAGAHPGMLVLAGAALGAAAALTVHYSNVNNNTKNIWNKMFHFKIDLLLCSVIFIQFKNANRIHEEEHELPREGVLSRQFLTKIGLPNEANAKTVGGESAEKIKKCLFVSVLRCGNSLKKKKKKALHKIRGNNKRHVKSGIGEKSIRAKLMDINPRKKRYASGSEKNIFKKSGAIAQYETTPLLLEVYPAPPHGSRDPNQPIANFRCISVAPEEARNQFAAASRKDPLSRRRLALLTANTYGNVGDMKCNADNWFMR
ncbi:Leucine-rich repeat-containing protein 26 [Melipona quadrifasciata]|uniref:Leucine-rich repeat-containing protein 26 n=1 Tax=Melipona quadrifasciata TaxID=166423 RepID=A0A0M9A0S3_9HYME|nr:Leucine-rich repeat-containing protein 26 [Melipona quadrifasciata]